MVRGSSTQGLRNYVGYVNTAMLLDLRTPWKCYIKISAYRIPGPFSGCCLGSPNSYATGFRWAPYSSAFLDVVDAGIGVDRLYKAGEYLLLNPNNVNALVWPRGIIRRY